MNDFLKKCSLFFLQFCLFTVIIIIVYILRYDITSNDIPAPRLSDSYSLNEKIEFLRKSKKNTAIITIGSSISLNNLHSETIKRKLHSDSYLNASSWGMNMQDNYSLLKVLHEVYHPNTIIIASSISEFELPPKQVDYPVVKNYLTSSNVVSDFYHLTCFNLRYYMKNFKYTKLVKSAKNQYEYLGFDENGGVNIDDNNFKIDSVRWDFDFNFKKIIPINYTYLDSISKFCKSNNIKLLFFQSPFRRGLYTKLDNKKLNEMELYINHVENILKKDKHMFINSNKILWADTFFIDSEHFNIKGAKNFTEYCFSQIDSINAN